MGGKKSSFRMENEVNGYGNTTYVKARTQGVHLPLSQENVQLTPDFGKFILTVLGANPTVIIPANADPDFLSMLGAMSSANQAIINKDQAGNYNVTFHLSEQSLTNGSYLQAMQTSSNVNKSNIGVVGKWELDGSRWRYYLNGYVKGQWVNYKDRWYYLDQNGYMALGWQTIGGKKYYLKSKKSKGLEAGGYMVTGWDKIDGTWYYFRSSGELLTNNWKQGKDGKWYFCGKNGAMATSKIIDWKGKKYFVDDDGVMAVNRTITDPETGKKYKAGADGVLEGEETIMINDWLIGHSKPSRKGGRKAKAAKGVKKFIDWYAYENLTKLNKYVIYEFPGLKAMQGGDKELIDEEGYYWIAAGPKIINASYSDDGDLRVGGKGNKRLEMGKYADVVIKRRDEPEVYLYCRIGEVRAHTWIDKGNKENGLSQTGYPYPNNASGEKPNPDSADGSTVEFMGMKGNNGTLSEYKLVKIVVFD
ncbi:MAG: cell wall hydrolase [Lacrimispora sp.]|nr:cell wall hydrolase [Lacrimispora sp.]